MTRKDQHNQLARALAEWENEGGAVTSVNGGTLKRNRRSRGERGAPP
jgi:hypothetical protein